MTFDAFFKSATGFPPHPWQTALAQRDELDHQLIRIPTGMGKTLGVASVWLFHRVKRQDLSWPTRLVWVLPMRVLVEQTVQALKDLVSSSGLEVEVVPCMGGLVKNEYALRPETPTILVGTQDMLVSRCLMRGYAAARGRWPVDFGLLSRDALTVCDEIQLMDVALPTTVQLAAFRGRGGIRPARTWWMSATLQPSWLETVDFRGDAPVLEERMLLVGEDDRTGGPWTSRKELSLRDDLADDVALCGAVSDAHSHGTLTLVIVNRVDRAVAIHKRLSKSTKAEMKLIHSRFRPYERESWAEFLRRDIPTPEAGRIIVATQVVEAGVDISADLLVTDLAPWASLVQRFGRAARYPGEQAQVWVCGPAPQKEKDALPYTPDELAAAWTALATIADTTGRVDLSALAQFDAALEEANVEELFPRPTGAILRNADLLNLFDTTPDLSGSDIDVAPFIRSGDTRDVSVFWRAIEDGVPDGTLPHRRELCAAPIGRVKQWLEKVDRWWILDYGEGWVRGNRTRLSRLVPGRTVLVPCEAGGYDDQLGFMPRSKSSVSEVPATEQASAPFDRTAANSESEALSSAVWRTIATHGADTSNLVRASAQALGLPEPIGDLLSLAGRWHDVGKSHPVFQACIHDTARDQLDDPARQDLAKAPDGSWRFAKRRGFRHELASALALLELLRLRDPTHDALIGPTTELLAILGQEVSTEAKLAHHPLADEIASLDAPRFNLLLWLVATHHGKVRCGWSSTAHDQESMKKSSEVQLQIHGVRQGDQLPEIDVATSSGAETLPRLELDLAPATLGLDARYGPSWAERVALLLQEHGPFDLAYLEALLRAADARASQLAETDPRVS